MYGSAGNISAGYVSKLYFIVVWFLGKGMSVLVAGAPYVLYFIVVWFGCRRGIISRGYSENSTIVLHCCLILGKAFKAVKAASLGENCTSLLFDSVESCLQHTLGRVRHCTSLLFDSCWYSKENHSIIWYCIVLHCCLIPLTPLKVSGGFTVNCTSLLFDSGMVLLWSCMLRSSPRV